MFVNRRELKAQLVRQDMTASDLAKILGISRQAVSVKLNGRSKFSEDEIKVLKDRFGLEIFY